MSSPFTNGAEPFQGFTEFDELALDELDEFSQYEFADPERFETDFEFEPEEERGGMRGARAAGARRPAPFRRPPRGIGARPVSRRPSVRPRRPGARPPRRTKPPLGARPSRRPRRPRRPWPRPGFPLIFPPYPAHLSGACPSVGRFGNWLRSGDQLIILLDEDEKPIDEGAGGASASVPPAPPTEDAPTEPMSGAAGAPTEGATGAPSNGGAADAPPEGTEGELWGRGGLSRRRLIQRALNRRRGLE